MQLLLGLGIPSANQPTTLAPVAKDGSKDEAEDEAAGTNNNNTEQENDDAHAVQENKDDRKNKDNGTGEGDGVSKEVRVQYASGGGDCKSIPESSHLQGA